MPLIRDYDVETVPFQPWETFYNGLSWGQGQHVALIGPTGSGKTTLALWLLPRRTYTVVFATKPRDKTMDSLIKHSGYKKFGAWSDRDSAIVTPKRVLWPDASKLNAAPSQHRVFRKALEQIYVVGNWCVYIDELWFVSNNLKLQNEIKTYLQQGRSIGISLVLATQRPAFIPTEVYDQSTHLFFWRDNDETNLKRISGIAFLSAALVKSAVANLREHEVLYINTKTGTLIRTMSPKPGTKPTTLVRKPA